MLRYLEATQEADGNWAQNLWLDGRPYWSGIQMDETAFPVLLIDLIRREAPEALGKLDRWWPMVRKAVTLHSSQWPGHAAGSLGRRRRIFAIHTGCRNFRHYWPPQISPNSQDMPNRLKSCAIPPTHGTTTSNAGPTLRTATWRNNSELTATTFALHLRYTDGAASPTQGFVPIKNRPPGQDGERAYHIISPDALALVRFGLRAPDDPRILNTLRAIDALLAVELPQGPCWYRYNGDGYGEHKDGSAFDGTGIGRPWPLLAGERAHYALAAGHRDEAEALLTVMENSTVGTRPLATRTESGIPLTFQRWSSSAASRLVRLVRSSGRIRSTSSCDDRSATARFSISRHKP